jgi:hypothetical protein
MLLVQQPGTDLPAVHRQARRSGPSNDYYLRSEKWLSN